MPRPFDPDALLSQPLMANVATVSAEGAPRNAPMWFLWEGGAIWLLSDERASTVTRLARNPNCAVEIVKFDNEAGVLLHLGLRGAASVAPNDPVRFRRLLTKYLGVEARWNPWFLANIARIEDESGRFIRLAPSSTFTNNVSYFRTGPDLAWPGD